MSFIKYAGENSDILAWVSGINHYIEETAMKQLYQITRLPFIFKHIAVLPDVHAGMGATIGSVIPTIGVVLPSAVGVDIGCGMIAARLTISAGDLTNIGLIKVRAALEAAVPHGRSANGGKGDRGAWGDTPNHVNAAWMDHCRPKQYFDLIKKYKALAKANWINHLGTLGGGNHFIEVCLDEHNGVWLMLHSGSRGIGNKIGMSFHKLAKESCKRWHIQLPSPDLAYFPDDTEEGQDYIHAAEWAQNFALVNRHVMLDTSLRALAEVLHSKVDIDQGPFECHHNFIQKEHHFGRNIWVTRKGAVQAKEGQWGIIPGSMGTQSYITQGKGEKLSFESSSHGAGRKMSRSVAKKTFTVEDHIRATEGVECRKDMSVIDETPGSYKDIDAVMDSQTDLVDIKYRIKQIICVKG